MALTEGKIENVPIGKNEMTLSFSQNAKANVFVITQKSDAWTMIFSQPKGKYQTWIVNSTIIKPELIGEVEQISISERITNLELVH